MGNRRGDTNRSTELTQRAGSKGPAPFLMTREQITREFELFGTVIAASTADTTRRRTAYFYRRQAIQWAQMGRQWWPSPGFAALCRRLAKSYLATYRQMKSKESI